MIDKVMNGLVFIILAPVLFALYISIIAYLIYAFIFGIEGRVVTFRLQIGKRTFEWKRTKSVKHATP